MTCSAVSPSLRQRDDGILRDILYFLWRRRILRARQHGKAEKGAVP